MEDFFSKLYGRYINKIHDFLNSNSDILYIDGFSGSGKSSVLKKALEEYEKEILSFYYLCFKDTVTDDFLLSFYDSFKMYALKEKITLKQNPETEFVQKVNFYFKNLEFPAVVVIDNFEIIPDSSDIIDFLIHISGFENVKIIIISKNSSCSLIENPTVSIEHLTFEKIDYELFEEATIQKFPNAEIELIQKLYNITEGFELYLKMTLNYLNSIGTPLADFINEFETKETSFGNFIIEKQISLIPSTYYPILKNLAYINLNVRPKFIQVYGLGDIKQIPYLHSKFMISEFGGGYHIKSYLKNYFEEIASVQEKTQSYKKIISIYKNELKKSPKDRILRMSRESIRNQVAYLEKKLPQVAKEGATPLFNYIPTPIENTAQWFITAKVPSPKQKKPERKRQKPPELKKTGKFEELILKAVKFEEEYEYKEAIETLESAKHEAKKLEEKISVYSKIAKDFLKTDNANSALSNLSELCVICKKEGENGLYAKYRVEIGKIYRKLYSFSRAKECFNEIIAKKGSVSDKMLAEAKIALAEIYELENNTAGAIEEYKSSISLLEENSKLLPEILYKIGSLQDDEGLYEDALNSYLDSIHYAEISGCETFLIKAYSACGIIYADYGQTDEALSYLEYALELSRGAEDYLDTYFIARSIAGIYNNIEPQKAYEYLMLALEYARLSDNSFEIAISLLELGDYYYNSKQNEQALICYFQAKKYLGENNSKENMERITTRINDMKIKLGEYVYNAMKALYDS